MASPRRAAPAVGLATPSTRSSWEHGAGVAARPDSFHSPPALGSCCSFATKARKLDLACARGSKRQGAAQRGGWGRGGRARRGDGRQPRHTVLADGQPRVLRCSRQGWAGVGRGDGVVRRAAAAAAARGRRTAAPWPLLVGRRLRAPQVRAGGRRAAGRQLRVTGVAVDASRSGSGRRRRFEQPAVGAVIWVAPSASAVPGTTSRFAGRARARTQEMAPVQYKPQRRGPCMPCSVAVASPAPTDAAAASM